MKSYPIVDGLIDVFGNWLIHRREMLELRQLDSREFDNIARDLRMTPADLDTFVRQGPHAADELPRLLKVLGIDEAALVRGRAGGAARHETRLRFMRTEGPMPQRS
jgi:hypothetical protein